MPNIEIHGYGRKKSCPSLPLLVVTIAEEAFEMRDRIDKVMQDIGLGGNAITTIYPTIATSCDGEKTRMPYLRISNTKPEETTRIIDKLKEAEIITDIETLTLTGFIPKE